MSKKLDHDVIIVGAGPAGSTAGYILSKLGLNVLIIDKETFPRKKLCGGGVTLKALQLIIKIFGETYSSLKQKNIINYITNESEITYRRSKTIVKIKSEYPLIFVDRSIYDNFLLQKAKNIGAEVIEGQPVKSVNLDECSVSLSDGTVLNSRFIIGADGPNSVVRREFSRKGLITQKQWSHNLATGLEVFIDREELKNDEFKNFIMGFGIVNWGYAWMIPKKDKIAVGLGALNRKNRKNFKNALRDWISCLNLNPSVMDGLSSHPVPYGNFKFKPSYEGKVFLIGDAGGFTCPLFGEGLYLAKKTAEFVATAIYNNINDNKAIEEAFLWNLKKRIYPNLEASMTLRKIFFHKFFSAFKFKLAGAFMRRYNHMIMEIMVGDRSFKWLKRNNLNLLELIK